MTESYRPGWRGPCWIVSREGISVADADHPVDVSWDGLGAVEVEECSVRVSVGSERLVLGQRWTGTVPPSSFVAAVRAFLPLRFRTPEVESALLCIWGWARSSELGKTRECGRCGSGLLPVVREALLTGRFADVEVVLRDVDRRVCSGCGAGYPTDEEQIGQSDLLFEVSHAWPKDDTDWGAGLTVELRSRGFFGRKRGLLHVRVLAPDPERPPPGDIHLAVLNAVCGESPPA
jgi:hypothetical protein